MINEEKIKKEAFELEVKRTFDSGWVILGPGYESYSGYESCDDVTLGRKLQIW